MVSAKPMVGLQYDFLIRQHLLLGGLVEAATCVALQSGCPLIAVDPVPTESTGLSLYVVSLSHSVPHTATALTKNPCRRRFYSFDSFPFLRASPDVV